MRNTEFSWNDLISSTSLFVLQVMRIKSLEGTPTSIIFTALRLRWRSISSHREEFTGFNSDSLHRNVKAKRRQWSLPNDGNGVSFGGDFQAVGGSNNIVNARDGTAMKGIVHNNHLGLVGYYLGSGVYTKPGVLDCHMSSHVPLVGIVLQRIRTSGYYFGPFPMLFATLQPPFLLLAQVEYCVHENATVGDKWNHFLL